MTLSIVARHPASGQLGVAIATRLPCVGSFCPVIRPRLAAAVTQAWTNPDLPYRVFERIEAGDGAERALAAVMAAEVDAALRQVAVVDARGGVAAFTGDAVEPEMGHRLGAQFAVQGNMLPDVGVLDAMQDAFTADPAAALAERLLAALDAGARGGGDARGLRSAALKVMGEEVHPLVDLRVDEHADPLVELRRLYRLVERELFPFLAALPTRANPRGRFETVREALRPNRRR